MPLSRSRDYLSIGEVLDAVRPEFPDISISKIRFLEAEGLLAPERTPSGYRKYYDSDLRRLRHILSLQRDHFMPLRVIKQRLETGGEAPPAPPETAATAPGGSAPAAPDLTDVSMSRDELASAAGLTAQQMAGLEEFGILPKANGSYDGSALAIAKAARGFFRYGIEPRHLRLYRQVVEREVGFLEQVLMPSANRRDPEAARRAASSLGELVALSRQMREALLRSALEDLL